MNEYARGIGWIGDLGTGNGSPGSLQGSEDESGNTEPDDHPGNGKGQGKGKGPKADTPTDSVLPPELDATTESVPTATDGFTLDSMITEETEPTTDITTELVKENPIRYAGYYWDRKTQFYYLQARYYDPRPARFISEDTYEGQIDNPLTLNLYTYVHNNPLSYIDPSGHIPTPSEAAEIAQHIYGATVKDYGKPLSGGWTLDDIQTNDEGLKMGVYSRVKEDGTTEYALVNKGTSTGGIGAIIFNNQ